MVNHRLCHDAHRLAATPMDEVDDQQALKEDEARPPLRRRELQHLPGPAPPGLKLQFGSLTHTDKAGVRDQAIARRPTASTSAPGALGRRRSPSGSATAPTSPTEPDQGVRRYLDSMSHLRGAPHRLAHVHRAQTYEPPLFDRDRDWAGHRRRDSRGALPRRPRPPRARTEHRADRRRLGELGSFHFDDSKSQQRPRHRPRPAPSPDLQRAGSRPRPRWRVRSA